MGYWHCRCWQCVAGVKTIAAETVERRVSETSSFAMNLFRGQVRPEEVFPFRDGVCDLYTDWHMSRLLYIFVLDKIFKFEFSTVCSCVHRHILLIFWKLTDLLDMESYCNETLNMNLLLLKLIFVYSRYTRRCVFLVFSILWNEVKRLSGIDICCLSVLTEDQHHTLKSLVGPVEEFLTVITPCFVLVWYLWQSSIS